LNHIENLWRKLKIHVMARKPLNPKNLETFAKLEYTKITIETHINLVSNYKNCLYAVIANKAIKGSAIDCK
jgi:hypothetical protein